MWISVIIRVFIRILKDLLAGSTVRVPYVPPEAHLWSGSQIFLMIMAKGMERVMERVRVHGWNY